MHYRFRGNEGGEGLELIINMSMSITLKFLSAVLDYVKKTQGSVFIYFNRGLSFLSLVKL